MVLSRQNLGGCHRWEELVQWRLIMEELQDTHILNKITTSAQVVSRRLSGLPIVIGLILLTFGIATGYFFNQKAGSITQVGEKESKTGVSGSVKESRVYGSADEKAFRDVTEGLLEKGGLDGEGSHKLIRPGGESQTAYLTSSTLNLDQFVGRKVKVWGETFRAQKAGWFMDVGRVEILE